jgi:hypothetical protein
VQYYYGRLPETAVFAELSSSRVSSVLLENSRYNQLGADLSSSIGSMNVRGEISANLADDSSLSDRAVRKPSILWSVGSDRALAGGLKLDAHYSGAGATDTMLSLRLSKKMIDERLSLSAAALYDIDSPNCLMKTSLDWTVNSCRIELCSGVYTGLSASDLMTLPGNDYVKFTVAYDF